MRHLLTLFRHEIRVILISPSTYIAAALFLATMGYVFQWLLTNYTLQASDTSPAVDFFRMFFIPAFFVTPLLTMRSLAEERRTGTLETLMTTPVTSGAVVLAKFGAALAFYLGLWASTVAFHGVLFHFADNTNQIDLGPILGGYLFVALSGTLFVATGIFASALTRSQLVSALVCFLLLLVEVFGGLGLSQLSVLQGSSESLTNQIVDHLQVFNHANDFVTGVIDSRPVVFYLSTSGLLLFLSMLALDARSARA